MMCNCEGEGEGSAVALLTAITTASVFTLMKQHTTITLTSTIFSTDTISATTFNFVSINLLTSAFSSDITTETLTSVAAVTSMNATATTAAPIFLVNPGAELGTRNPWTSTSDSSPMLDGRTANGGSTPPYNGSYDFYGGSGGGSLHQKVPLTSIFSTTQLDSGLLYAFISFWEKSASQSPPDTGQVTLDFLSATNSSLSSVTTGPQACVLVSCSAIGNWSLPIGTRTIDYVMTFVANYGSHSDAWIDDNSFIVA